MLFIILEIAIVVTVFGLSLTFARDKRQSWLGTLFSTPFMMVLIIGSTVNVLANSFVYTPICTAKTKVFFGVPIEGYMTPGPSFINPLYSTSTYETCRKQVNMTGENTLDGTVKGGVYMPRFDVTIPYKLNPRYLWVVRGELGTMDQLMDLFHNSARSAARSVQAKYTWQEITYEKRQAVETDFSQTFKETLTIDLMGAGLTEKQAEEVFIIPEVRLRKALPQETVLNARDNLERDRIERQRMEQQVLRSKKEIEKRENEGEAVARMVRKMGINDPDGESLPNIINALANLKRAGALQAAIDDKKRDIPVIVMGSGSSPSLAMPVK